MAKESHAGGPEYGGPPPELDGLFAVENVLHDYPSPFLIDLLIKIYFTCQVLYIETSCYIFAASAQVALSRLPYPGDSMIPIPGTTPQKHREQNLARLQSRGP